MFKFKNENKIYLNIKYKVPPSQRGGHSATLSGACIVIFGGHYYAGKQKGYVYLNDTFVLDVHSNRWTK